MSSLYLYVDSAISKERYFFPLGRYLELRSSPFVQYSRIADDTERRAVSLQHLTVLFAPTRITLVHFWATVCKTVRPMLSDRCPVCLSVCNVGELGVLRPNGWMDQDETWHARHSSPPPKGGRSPQFQAHICCGQTAGWIKVSLAREVLASAQGTLC